MVILRERKKVAQALLAERYVIPTGREYVRLLKPSFTDILVVDDHIEGQVSGPPENGARRR